MASSSAWDDAEHPASKVLITSRVADQNPNTIQASRLMLGGRRITAVSQFPGEVIRDNGFEDRGFAIHRRPSRSAGVRSQAFRFQDRPPFVRRRPSSRLSSWLSAIA